ncbi:MAG: magnesium chelatase family protein [Luteibaculaceae bacterium]|jgi:magnesium chelatase family protein
MLASVTSASLLGIECIPIKVEVHVGKGVKFHIVGLPDNAIKESERRIYAAIQNSSYKGPIHGVIINLSPADIRKEGSGFDLPMALGLLAATGQIPKHHLENTLFIGELGLDGSLSPVKGILSIVHYAKTAGLKAVFVPRKNYLEAKKIKGITIKGMDTLVHAIQILEGSESGEFPINSTSNDGPKSSLCFSDVKGQKIIKRAFQIAAIGRHNLIMIGPPGAGKTMLARRFSGILPPMREDEIIETSKIYSLIGSLGKKQLINHRPFRNPHHTISDVALVGGGSYPLPGEISLAHNGVLFLDELPEFKRQVLEVLRQPIELQEIKISRARFTVTYPSNFQLIAALNPCPCGYYNHPKQTCSCSSMMVSKYLSKISGPLLDRIDLHVEVTPVEIAELQDTRSEKARSTQEILHENMQVHEFQKSRFGTSPYIPNANYSIPEIRKFCSLPPDGQKMLGVWMEKLQLSARAYHKILLLARSIADLNFCGEIKTEHLAEAIQFRNLDRGNWTQNSR